MPIPSYQALKLPLLKFSADGKVHSFAEATQFLAKECKLSMLEAIKKCSADFFESLTLKLLLKMGYGNNIENTGQTTKKSHDHGIDGVIKEDKLGLGKVYIQAKKWIGTVGRPEIQKFAGALEGAKADKGVFITTSTFSKEAQNYVKEIGKKIALIDGVALADYMIEHDIGILPSVTYEIKRLDTKYFT